MPVVMDEREAAWRRAKYEQIASAQARDAERMTHLEQIFAARAAIRGEAVGFLDALRHDGDLQAFKDAMGSWSKKPPFVAFGAWARCSSTRSPI